MAPLFDYYYSLRHLIQWKKQQQQQQQQRKKNLIHNLMTVVKRKSFILCFHIRCSLFVRCTLGAFVLHITQRGDCFFFIIVAFTIEKLWMLFAQNQTPIIWFESKFSFKYSPISYCGTYLLFWYFLFLPFCTLCSVSFAALSYI